MAFSSACECGAEEQTVDQVLLQCPIYRTPHGLHGLMFLDDETTAWLLNTCPEIEAAKQWIKEELTQTKEEMLQIVLKWCMTFVEAQFSRRSVSRCLNTNMNDIGAQSVNYV